MANKLKVYKIEDVQTGKVYEIEGPEGASDDELYSFLEQDLAAPTPEPQPQVEAQPNIPVEADMGTPVAASSGVQTPRQDIESVVVNSPLNDADPRWLGDNEETYKQLVSDPNIPWEDVNAWLREQAKAKDIPASGIMLNQSDLAEFRRQKAANPDAPVGAVIYSDWKNRLPTPGPTTSEKDGFFTDILRSHQEAGQQWGLGLISRSLNDWMDTGGNIIDSKFPDATPEEREQLQEEYVNWLQKGVRAANQAEIAEDATIPWLLGQVFTPDPVDLVPFAKAAKGVSTVGKIARKTGEGAAVTGIADVAYQGADIASDVQEEFDPLQTALSVATGGALHGTVQGAGEVVSTLSRRSEMAAAKTSAEAPPSVPIAVPTARKNSKKYVQQVAETNTQIADHINVVTKDWKNAPEFEVHESFDTLPDVDSNAVGVFREDGKVLINTKAVLRDAKKAKVSPEDVINAVTFHEALGHHGLAQKFGDDLDRVMESLYDDGVSTFRKKVDERVAETGEGLPLAVEETLARMSEKGPLPVTIKDRVSNLLKDVARNMGLNLRFSEREIKAILGMAHNATINGKRNDVRGNGFKYMRRLEASDIGPGYDTKKATDLIYRSEDNPGVVQTERMWPNNPNIVDFRYVDPETSSEVYGAFHQNGDTAESLEIYGDGKNSLGPRTLQIIRRQLREQFPEIKKIEAMRVSGARNKGASVPYKHGKPVSVKLSKYMREYTKQEAADEAAILSARRTISEALENYTPTYRSWEEGKRAARERGLTAEEIRKAKSIGELDKKIFMYDAAAQKLDEKLARLNEKIDAGTFTPVDKANYLKTVFEFNETVARIWENQAEIARALNAMKAVQYTKNKFGALNEALAEIQGNNVSAFADDNVFQEFAENVKYLMEAGNLNGTHNVVKSVMKPYWWQYLLSFRHSMMLSGIGTHAKNTSDNALMIARELEETIMAVPGFAVRKGLQAAGMKNVSEGVSPQEAAARLYGLLRAALDTATYKDTYNAFRRGHGNREFSSKIEMQDAHIPGISKVQDVLYASDVFFRAFHTNANLYALGVREARKDGFKGLTAFEEGSNLAAMPTDEMRKAAREGADLALLVDTPSWVSSKLEAAKSIRPNMKPSEQIGAFAANLLFPFFRVTDRLMFQKLRRSPLSFLDKNTRADIAAGGARMDIAIARTLYGSALIYYYWTQAGEDEIVGSGPSDYKKLQALEAGGYKENAVVADDAYVDATALNLSLFPWDLQNSVAANVATIRKAYEDGTATPDETAEGIGMATLSLLTILTSESFAGNLDMYIAPFSESGEAEKDIATANFLGSMGSQWIPAAMRQYNQAVHDPIKRDTTGDKSMGDRITGRIKSGIPGLSDDLPVRYDLYGDLVPHGRSLSGMDNFSPIKKDAVSQELQKLERTTPDAVVTGAPSSFKHEGETIKLTADGKQEWQRVQGYYLRTWMAEEISSPEWRTLSNEDKIALVKSVKKEAYEATKEYMLPLLGVVAEEEE